jgi:hypothetical protein
MDAIERAVRARQIELFRGRVSREGLERLIAIALRVEREERQGVGRARRAAGRIYGLGAVTPAPVASEALERPATRPRRRRRRRDRGQPAPAVAVVPTSAQAPPPARRVVTYPVKPCAVCRRRFQPSGPRSKYCARPACVATRASR